MTGRARAATKRRPRQPAVDTYGTLRFPSEGEARGRLIEYAVDQYAFFTESDLTHPMTFDVTDAHVKGRVLTATTPAGEVKFQKAGCGCETPYSLRGGRNKLLRDAGLEDTPEELAPPTIMESVLNGAAPIDADEAYARALDEEVADGRAV